MTNTLKERFFFGNSGWVIPFIHNSDWFYESHSKEQEFISLARQQIEIQKSASREIAKSNIEGAKIISAELKQQTKNLEKTITQFSEEISKSLDNAVEKINEAIDQIGDRICIELSEIRWQLSQQLEHIFEILYNKRTTEARALVRQGIRHYINSKLEDAEEIFQEAYHMDKTDYQVLMYLAYIEIHKGNAKQARDYFNDALKLPEPDTIDATSRAHTLWSIARLAYSERKFSESFSYAEKAFKNDNQQDPKNIYSLGLYAFLAGVHK